tara:strand:+ start:597 stop:1328 length:732 start_codon:yes stop_codon:yes gene_type:complete
MAVNGPRIMGYAYSEGPTYGVAAPLVVNSTLAIVEQLTPGTTTYVRPLAPELFDAQLATWAAGLSAMAGAPAGTYAVTYDATTQRVTIATTNAVAFAPVMIGNLAAWLGFTQTLTGFGLTWTGASAPAALAELLGVTIEPAEDSARVDLTSYRHGRSIAIAWGNHQTHRVRLTFSRSTTLAQIKAGYLTAGRVRIWQFGDATAYSAINPGGYVDGYVIAADDPAESGDIGELWTLDLVVGVTS